MPDAPSDIKFVYESNDVVFVAWKRPRRANGILTKYTLYVRTVETGREVLNTIY